MRARSAIWFLFALAPSVVSANSSFQGVVSLSGGYTSNAGNVASGSPEATPDALIIVSPSVVFTSALARALQRVSYNFTAQFYATHPELATITNRLDWSGVFTPSPTTELATTAFVLQSRLNSAVFDDTGTQITRVGTETFWNVGLSERLGWLFSQQGRLTQTLGFSSFIPTGSGFGQTYITTAALALDRLFRKDSFGGELQLGNYYYQETRGPITNPDGTVDANGIVSPAQIEMSLTLMLRWRRDLGRFWNLNLGAGVATLFRATDGGGNIWQPVGEAGVHYLHPRFQTELTYLRALAPSPIVQSTFVSDTLALRFTVPFGMKSRLAFTAVGSYSHLQDADTLTGHLGTKVNLFSVDGGLSWIPLDWVIVGTHYTYFNQLGSTSSNPPIASIDRHVVQVSLTVTYPPKPAANVTTRAAIRVDRSDAPAFPELHSAPDK